jgi:hypothetical protein
MAMGIKNRAIIGGYLMGECSIVQRFKGSSKEIMRHFLGNITEPYPVMS